MESVDKNMKLDLKNEELFNEDEINFDKKVNFVYGKNGTGKSTITRLLKEQFGSDEKYDIRIFQGFDALVGERENLDCIILGKENIEIDSEIEEIENLISEKLDEIEEINKEIEEPLNNKEKNLYTKRQKAIGDFKKQVDKIDKELKKCASGIKNYDIKITNKKSYNINDLKDEISYAHLLSDNEVAVFMDILNSKIKTAEEINNDYANIDLNQIVNDINEILIYKVEPKKIIKRLGNDNRKFNFAKEGMHIHKSGDECAFCGNMVTKELLDELKSYFSADEIELFQQKIEDKLDYLDKCIKELRKIEINTSKFYADKVEEARTIKLNINSEKRNYIEFLNKIYKKLEEKKGNLFDRSDEFLEENIPSGLIEIIFKYNNLVKQNNSNDLLKKQNEARNKLRYHEIKKFLNKFKYEVEDEKKKILKENKNEIEEQYSAKKKEVGNINEFIEKSRGKIKELVAKKKSVQKAVKNINIKLKSSSSSFELFYDNKQEQEGFYKIKCLRTSRYKSVKELSTGEKNIIAFLYFIEELSDIEKEKLNSKKVIIFDDPMNSNDDTKQYLIINELQKMMRKIEKDNDKKLIILTHNCHFYLNVKHDRKYENECLENILDNKISNFIRLISDNKKTNIKYIKKREDDFTTSYDLLWKEIGFLNKLDVSSDVLYNPMRRILETYIKFNCIDQGDFYKESSFFKKACDVNSHSIDDLEHDLSGISNEKLIEDFRLCFEKNNAKAHFKKYFKKHFKNN